MDTDLFPGVFSSDFIIADAEVARLKPTVDLLRQRRILPRSLAAPIFVLWDLTYRCNLCCRHCYNNSSPKTPTNELSASELFTIAKELVDLQVFSVCLSGGEPRMREEFRDLAEYLGGHGIAVSTITNGCDLTDETIDLFAKTMALVQVSVESASESVHDAIRGRGTFAKAVTSIKKMKDAGVRQIRVSSVATRDSIGGFPALLQLCLQLGVHDLRGMPVVPIGRALTAHCPIPTLEQDQTLKDQVRRWTEDPAISSRISIEWGDPVQHIKIGLLYGFVLGTNITADGYYRFSPYFNVAMGNSRNMCLTDAWSQGLGMAWKHPEVASELETLSSPADFGRVFSDGISASSDGCLDLLGSSSASSAQETAHV